MSLFSAVLLGLVQGVAEFLPISSSGHLAIAEHLLNVQGASEIPEFYDVLLHLGTLVAVFAAYWDDIYDMIVELFAMVPIRDFFDGLGDNLYFIGGALITTGCLLFLSDRVRRGDKNERSARWIDALIVGLGQAVALCPGISRSGMTITTGCFVGFERKFAVRFSFIMSIPAILGANILSLKDALESEIDMASVPAYIAGVVVSAVVGYICIRLLKAIAAKGRFGAFAYYCWAVGALVLIFTAL